MRRTKTHFEQIPLEIVQKIVKEQLERENDGDDEIDEETLANGFGRAGEPSSADIGKFPD